MEEKKLVSGSVMQEIFQCCDSGVHNYLDKDPDSRPRNDQTVDENIPLLLEYGTVDALEEHPWKKKS